MSKDQFTSGVERIARHYASDETTFGRALLDLKKLGLSSDEAMNTLQNWKKENVIGERQQTIAHGDLVAENERLRKALERIIERSKNIELGTSKVLDMRSIADVALSSKEGE